jgi:hypothetical protein
MLQLGRGAWLQLISRRFKFKNMTCEYDKPLGDVVNRSRVGKIMIKAREIKSVFLPQRMCAALTETSQIFVRDGTGGVLHEAILVFTEVSGRVELMVDFNGGAHVTAIDGCLSDVRDKLVESQYSSDNDTITLSCINSPNVALRHGVILRLLTPRVPILPTPPGPTASERAQFVAALSVPAVGGDPHQTGAHWTILFELLSRFSAEQLLLDENGSCPLLRIIGASWAEFTYSRARGGIMSWGPFADISLVFVLSLLPRDAARTALTGAVVDGQDTCSYLLGVISGLPSRQQDGRMGYCHSPTEQQSRGVCWDYRDAITNGVREFICELAGMPDILRADRMWLPMASNERLQLSAYKNLTGLYNYLRVERDQMDGETLIALVVSLVKHVDGFSATGDNLLAMLVAMTGKRASWRDPRVRTAFEAHTSTLESNTGISRYYAGLNGCSDYFPVYARYKQWVQSFIGFCSI